jgi:carbon monoxide dehydrogenase subunit G
MHFEYILKIDLPINEAWATLMDIERIAPCMQGATIESRDGDDYTGRLKVKLGPMEMTYRGSIHFLERDDQGKFAIADAQAKEIKGRGEAKTQVTLRATATDDGTEIVMSSDFTVSGKAAQFGRGVMEEVGEKLMGDFAERLGKLVGEITPGAAVNLSDDHEAAPVVTATNSTEPKSPSPLADDNEALDIGSAVWGPLVKRLALPAAIIAILIVAYLAF